MYILQGLLLRSSSYLFSKKFCFLKLLFVISQHVIKQSVKSCDKWFARDTIRKLTVLKALFQVGKFTCWKPKSRQVYFSFAPTFRFKKSREIKIENKKYKNATVFSSQLKAKSKNQNKRLLIQHHSISFTFLALETCRQWQVRHRKTLFTMNRDS